MIEMNCKRESGKSVPAVWLDDDDDVCIYIYMYTHVYVCVYIIICVYVYIYIYILIVTALFNNTDSNGIFIVNILETIL